MMTRNAVQVQVQEKEKESNRRVCLQKTCVVLKHIAATPLLILILVFLLHLHTLLLIIN